MADLIGRRLCRTVRAWLRMISLAGDYAGRNDMTDSIGRGDYAGYEGMAVISLAGDYAGRSGMAGLIAWRGRYAGV